ncbi:fluoride efflux transporter FluC [Sabulicella glaciei]|uniref:Fluoride-specific ion channel FluC n=1 Tax=Sabulicella glaciei TaxID=2984948 RepID=A0ABT3NW02_9PROT|nr:CrcB family protein [Roseococcus sp. MDT2-1-1]MCW8086336.1 CrcB family protein [Roseococcus sp. MDT2-1-1]
MRIYLAVASGGALGSLARYGTSLAGVTLLGPAFPWGTLAVNVVGSWLIAFFAASGGRIAAREDARHFVMAGFCGGFTTFSVFSLEAVQMAQAGSVARAAAYVVLSAAAWIGAAWAGHAMAVRLSRRG